MLARILQASKIVSGISPGGSPPYATVTTDPFTPPANSILIARGSIEFNYVNGDRTSNVLISDSAGLTWIPLGNTFNTFSFCDATCGWYAHVGPAPAAMTVSISTDLFSGYTVFHNQVVSYTGFDPVGPIRQVLFTSQDGLVNVGPNPWTVNLMAPPLATSEVTAFLFVSSEIGLPGTGVPTAPYVNVYAVADTNDPHIMVATGTVSQAVPWLETFTNPPQTFNYVYQRSAMVVEIAVDPGLPSQTYGPAPIVGTDNDVMGDANDYRPQGDAFSMYIDDADPSGGWFCSGLRFTGIDFSNIAFLQNATLTLIRTLANNNGANGVVRIKCEDANQPAIYSALSRPYNRPLRAAYLDYDFPANTNTLVIDVKILILDLLAAGYTYTGLAADAIAFVFGAQNEFGIAAVSYRQLFNDVDWGTPALFTADYAYSPPSPGGSNLGFVPTFVAGF